MIWSQSTSAYHREQKFDNRGLFNLAGKRRIQGMEVTARQIQSKNEVQILNTQGITRNNLPRTVIYFPLLENIF